MPTSFDVRRRTPAAWLAAAALACGLVVLHRQQPPPDQPPPDPQRPTFRAGANLVRVDVTVIDHHGEPVIDLEKTDFEVREDGVPQTVETFKFIQATGQPPADDDVSLAIRSPEHAAVEAARDDVRVFLIFWDEYHIAQLMPAHSGREAILDFVRNSFGPTDLVAIMDPLTPLDAIRFTRDRSDLAEQARRLRGRLGVYMPPRSALEEGQMYAMRDVEPLRAQVTASALEGAILFLRALREGRKSIVFVSQDIGPIGGGGPGGVTERYHWLDKAIRLANDGNTAIYTVDPRGFSGRGMSDVLRSLAEQTGGKAIQSNDPAAALRRVVKDASAFYLLGYSSAAPADGKFHKIKVRLKRDGVEVRARNGYVSPSVVELEAAHKTATAAEVPPAISNAIAAATPRADSRGDLWAGADPGQPGGSARLTVTWLPRDDTSGGPPSTPAPVVITATAADGRVLFEGPLTATRVTFAAAPGPVKIRRTLLDPDGTAGDRQDTTVTVPDFASAPLSIATPVFLRARTGVELNALRKADDPVPYAGHEFDRGDRVLVRIAVAGASATGATVKVSLLGRQGKPLSEVPVRAIEGKPGAYELELVIASIGRGDYVLAIDAAQGDAHDRSLTAFRVR